jgi:hypothetical protein
LGLSGVLALEWSSFCKVLIGSRVQLQKREENIIWTSGDNSGLLFVKNVYNALQFFFGSNNMLVGGGFYGLGIFL